MHCFVCARRGVERAAVALGPHCWIALTPDRSALLGAYLAGYGEEFRAVVPDLRPPAERLAGTGRYSNSRTTVPVERWHEVAALAGRVGLREAGARLGVSHESVRVICRRVEEAVAAAD
jgi:hypothetical protein